MLGRRIDQESVRETESRRLGRECAGMTDRHEYVAAHGNCVVLRCDGYLASLLRQAQY